MKIQELDKLFKDKIGDYFEQNKSDESTEQLLQLMVEMTAKIVYCCMDEKSQQQPKAGAKQFGDIVSQRTAASINTLKQVHKIFNIPLPTGERIH